MLGVEGQRIFLVFPSSPVLLCASGCSYVCPNRTFVRLMRKLRVKASQRLENPSYKSQDSRVQDEHEHSGHSN